MTHTENIISNIKRLSKQNQVDSLSTYKTMARVIWKLPISKDKVFQILSDIRNNLGLADVGKWK